MAGLLRPFLQGLNAIVELTAQPMFLKRSFCERVAQRLKSLEIHSMRSIMRIGLEAEFASQPIPTEYLIAECLSAADGGNGEETLLCPLPTFL
jgi:hypothetical protein